MKYSAIQKSLLALPAAVALNLVAISPASAELGVMCDIQQCTINIHQGLSISASVDNFYNKTEGQYEMVGDLVVTLPNSEVDLLDAYLVFEQTPEGSDLPFEIYGTAKAPFGSIPLLGNGSAAMQPMASVGLVSRDTLQSLLASGEKPLPLAENPVEPEAASDEIKQPAYLFFHYENGLSFDIPLNEILPTDNEHFGFSIPGEQSVTLVFDPQEPYFYLSSEAIFDFGEKMQQAISWANEDNRNTVQTDSNQESLLDQLPLPSLNQLAWSTEGGIPLKFDTLWGMPYGYDDIKGHLFVDASMPLYKFFELDGEIVTSIGKDGYTQAGNGDLAVNFDLIPNVLNFSFNLGRASAGVVINSEEKSGFFSGIRKADTSFLPHWIPLQPISETLIAGYISADNPQHSYLKARGAFGFSPQFLSDLLGVQLNDIVLSQSQMEISATGILVKGKSSTSIHPALKLNKSTDVEIFLPFANLADASIKMSGEIMVLGTGISPAKVEISRTGFFINGQLNMPLSVIAMSGEIAATGPALKGMTKINLPLDKITEALSDAQYAVATARNKVNELQSLVDAEIAKVIARRAAHAEKLQMAQDALSIAQDKVGNIQKAIDYQYYLINKYRGHITSKYKWYKSQPWYNKSWAWGVYAAYKTYKYGQISAAYAQIGILNTAKLAAIGILEVAKFSLSVLEAATETLPPELDAKVVTLVTSKEAANLVLLAAEEVLKRIPVIDLNAGTQLMVSLDKQGLQGDVSMIINDKNFVGGKISFDPVPKACIELPVVGELCTPF